MTPEGKVKAALKKWLDRQGFWRAGADRPKLAVQGWYYMPQNRGMGVSGIPDFVGSFIMDGHYPRPFGIEAKKPGGITTQLQRDRHEEMRAAGWLIFVIDDVNTLDTELEALRG